ncbi:hypothetical protein MACH09_08000 [Vibrio sp. MACH09]|uniref:chromosome partitioning protein ParA n=1 Tax=unclassified Vibrio TaxID=2614977 RepID=UPI0014932D64|nr:MULTISPECIES: chromosome partitioning protein ParA [unclassified Vibrio]NOI67772.1 chromosome partitioning protein ParA [Vibrio sp. 99-8-1]GLO60292.1 hypothetical protein MACH09_08000 [Vibrio sp. MACH09]
MVMINGLPATTVANTSKAQKNSPAKKQQNRSQIAQTTKVADAVAHSIRHVDESEIERAQIQYDLPPGGSRKAMEEYMDVLNQARKEELAQLIGVDLYI